MVSMKPNNDRTFIFLFTCCLLTEFLTLVKGKCQLPEIPENSKMHVVRGAMDENGNVQEGTIVRFYCDRGYRAVTSNGMSTTMICSKRGWSKSPPECKAIPCPEPPEIEHGHITDRKTFYKHNDIAIYECDNAYGLFGDSVLVCDFKYGILTWLGKAPYCEKIHLDCTDPGAPKDGFRKGACCEHENTVSFSCFQGLELEGSSEITCFNGHWSNETPKCTSDVCCPPPPELPNGKINSTERGCLVPREFVDATCDPGFALTDGSYRTYCEENGEWNKKFPSCQEIHLDCIDPGAPKDGFRTGDCCEHKSTVSFSCFKGLELKGSSEITCFNGSWSHEIPKCTSDVCCPPPPELPNGKINGTERGCLVPREFVDATCGIGFAITDGSYRTYCEENGEWDQKFPSCQEIHLDCIDPGAPKDGFRKGDCCEHKSTVSFSCFKGLQLEGSSDEITCFNGTWSHEIPKCISDVCCPPPPELPNGKINGTERGCLVPWEFVDATCDPGYTITDGSYRTYCEKDGEWDQNFPSCQEIHFDCIDPGAPKDGFRKGDCCEHKSTVSFSCFKGLELKGSSEITCFNGSWSDEIPKCTSDVCCPPPPELPNGKINGTERGCLVPREFVDATCDPGFAITDGSYRTYCEENGEWDQKFPSCQEIHLDCIDPGAPKDGFRKGDCCEHKSTVSFSCFKGLQLKGSSDEITCFNGTWSHEIPKCISDVCCPPPPELPNGKINGTERGCLVPSEFVDATCDPGYTITDGNYRTYCEEDGEWDQNFPSCQEIHSDCTDPGEPKDGFRTGDCCEHECTVSFSCFEGLELIGSSEITCFNGRWSDEIPKCTSDVCCPPPPELPNGKINGTERGCLVPWEFVDATCDPGFTLIHGSYRTYCEETGEWDQNFPSCQAPECSFPDIPQNGTIKDLELFINYTPNEDGPVQDLESRVNQTTNKNVKLRAIEKIISEMKLPYRSEIHFKCNPGFRMIGSSFITCEAKGWTDSTPKCELIQCPEPVAPENGWRSGDSFDVKDKVTFGCSSGYHLLGSTRRTCLENGRWSGETARCTSKDDYCPNPGTPLNGFKIGKRYQLGDRVEFQCSPGHFMIGSPIRFCHNNKDWNGTQPQCIAANDFETAKSLSTRFFQMVEDLYPEVIENVIDERGQRLDLSFSGLRVIIFVFDTSKSVGKKHFDRSIQFAKVLVEKVGIHPERSRVGAISFSTDVEIAFLPTDYRTTEEVLDALERIQYNDGGTAMVKALKTIRQVIIPLITQAEDWKNTPKEFDIFLLTDGKPNMAGEPFEETDKLKKQNVKIHCIGITGSLDMEKLYQMASEPKDEYVFILSSYDVMQDLIADLTNRSVDYGHCGLRPRLPDHMAKPQGDDRQKMLLGAQVEKPWPWMVALYNTTGKDRKYKIFLCGGSLINNRWVLTAAHCLTESKEGYRITVELGLTSHANRTAVEEYEIQSIIMHENYDKENYDYDIALLKLKKIVAFSRYVRPVCLPPPLQNIPAESNFYGPLEDSIATRWGYDKPKRGEFIRNFRPTNVLKYGHIPIQSRSVCEDFVERERQARSKNDWHKYQFTDSMFCAGTGGDEPTFNTCRGDSGGPLMQSDLEGTQWTQVGIISWGLGCGQPKKYGFYTHVAYLRNWIDDKVQEKSKDL